MKKLFIGLFLSLLGIISFSHAQSLGGFTIKNYDVNIDIQNDGEMQIHESILVNFSEDRHGIYRNIPYLYTSTYGTIYPTRVYDTYVDDYMFDSYKEGNNIVIKIGDPDVYVNGDQFYNIYYKVYGGIIGFSGYQELYRNIIGSERDTTIDKVNFTINFPKQISPTPQRFTYYGYEGSTEPLKTVSWTNKQTIKGSASNLNNYEAVTIGIKLPSNYITIDPVKDQLRIQENKSIIQKLTTNPIWYLTFMIPLLLFIWLWNLWKKYGDDQPLTTMVNYDIPKDIDSALAGAICDQRSINKHIISLIYYRAVNGYVKLEETEQNLFIFKSKNYLIIKKKPLPDGVPSYQKSLRNAMFDNSDQFDPSVKSSSFSTSLRSISNNLKKTFEKKIYDPESIKAKKIASIPLWISIGIILVPFFFMGALIVAGLGVTLLFIAPSIIISFIISLIFYLIMDKKSPEGRKIYTEIRGFKKFMKMVEEPKLKQFLKQDPNYFDKTLPLAIAFGLQTVRTRKFESILTDKYHNNWIYGANRASIGSYISSVNSSMSSFGSGSCFGSSSGSGGSGGGGFSGGGGGGGGGGSW